GSCRPRERSRRSTGRHRVAGSAARGCRKGRGELFRSLPILRNKLSGNSRRSGTIAQKSPPKRTILGGRDFIPWTRHPAGVRGDGAGRPVNPITVRISLDDRHRAGAGRLYLSGLQALVRLPLDRVRLVRGAGLKTGGFISGYRGSPLAGY